LTALFRQVSAPVVTSQWINFQHVNWNHRSVDTYCRIKTGVVTTQVDMSSLWWRQETTINH